MSIAAQPAGLQPRGLRWAGFILLAAAAGLLLLGWPAALLGPVHAILLGLVIFLLPGYLLLALAMPAARWDGLSRIPLAFGLSLGVGLVAWAGAHLFGGTLVALSVLLAVAILALCAWNLVMGQRALGHTVADPRPAERAGPRWPLLLVFGTIAVWVIIVVRQGALFMPETDNWYYLAIVRRIASTGLLAPGDPYFAGIQDPGRGGLWESLVALVAVRSGLEPALIWNLLPAFLVPVAVLANYLLGLTLLRERAAAALACFFLLYGFGRFTWDAPMMLVSPAGIGFVLYLVALALVWRYLDDREGAALWLGLLVTAALAAVHLLVVAGLIAAVGGYLLLHAVIHRDKGHIGRGAVLIAGMLLPAILFAGGWAGSGPQTSNAIYQDEWGLLSQFRGWHIVRIGAVAGSGSSPWAWSFLLAPVLALLAKRRAWALFLLSTMLCAALIAFNPLLVEFVLRTRLMPPWGLWRLVLQVFQFQFVLGGLGALGACWWFERTRQEWGWRRPVSAALLATLVGIGFLPSSVPLVKPLWGYVTASVAHAPVGSPGASADETSVPSGWDPTLAYLRHEMPGGSTILADANTGFLISALTDQYVVAIPYGHSSPFVSDDEARRQDSGRALDPEAPISEVLSILERYRADYVLLAHVTPSLGKHSLTTEAYDRLKRRFSADPVHFGQVFTAEADPAARFVIFKVTPPGL